jgi:hypothetical protein
VSVGYGRFHDTLTAIDVVAMPVSRGDRSAHQLAATTATITSTSSESITRQHLHLPKLLHSHQAPFSTLDISNTGTLSLPDSSINPTNSTNMYPTGYGRSYGYPNYSSYNNTYPGYNNYAQNPYAQNLYAQNPYVPQNPYPPQNPYALQNACALRRANQQAAQLEHDSAYQRQHEAQIRQAKMHQIQQATIRRLQAQQENIQRNQRAQQTYREQVQAARAQQANIRHVQAQQEYMQRNQAQQAYREQVQAARVQQWRQADRYGDQTQQVWQYPRQPPASLQGEFLSLFLFLPGRYEFKRELC